LASWFFSGKENVCKRIQSIKWILEQSNSNSPYPNVLNYDYIIEFPKNNLTWQNAKVLFESKA